MAIEQKELPEPRNHTSPPMVLLNYCYTCNSTVSEEDWMTASDVTVHRRSRDEREK